MSIIGALGSGYGAYSGAYNTGLSGSQAASESPKAILNPGESTKTNPGKRVSPAECETCKNRKYQDGSDEMVSFKSAQTIAPAAVASKVRGHEQEHVSNAYAKAAQNNGKVIQASVTLHTAICPECGRTYISGGETRTQIKYYNEENPYQKDLKSADRSKYVGMNADFAV